MEYYREDLFPCASVKRPFPNALRINTHTHIHKYKLHQDHLPSEKYIQFFLFLFFKSSLEILENTRKHNSPDATNLF